MKIPVNGINICQRRPEERRGGRGGGEGGGEGRREEEGREEEREEGEGGHVHLAPHVNYANAASVYTCT